MKRSMVRRGVFICVEGLDGCGKTTQAKLLVRRLSRDYDAIYTAEPSKGTVGKFVKKKYLHSGKRGQVEVEALLFAADRLEHLKNEVLPALAEGKVVVSDRYVFSSFSYQGAAGVGLDWIEEVNKHALRPDLAVFIDVEPETVVRRLKRKKSVMENLQTQVKVREVYMKYVKNGRLVRIDGNKSKREAARDLTYLVKDWLQKVR